MTEGLHYSLDISEVTEFANMLEKSSLIAQQEIQIAVQKGLNLLEQQIEQRAPVNTGMLRESIAHEITRQPTGMRGDVFTPLIYGMPVEHGRKPGKMPPPDALQMWVTRKLGLRGKEAESVAFLIARAIGRRGTQGVHMFQKGFDAAKPHIESYWETVPDRILNRIAGMSS